MSRNDITVCICAYNAEKYIRETLDSLAKQTQSNFDVWVIDDASKDNTRKICEEFFNQHHWNIKNIVSLPENGGLARARRYAETHVKTKYIGFIDADDIMLPYAVETMMGWMEKDDDCISVSGYCSYMSPDGSDVQGGIYLGATSRDEFFKQAEEEKLIFRPPMNISHVAWLLKAGGRAIDGFPPGKPRYQDMCEDLDLWTRMSDFYTEGKYMVVIPEVLFRYRKIPTSMSSNGKAMNMRMRHIKANLKRRRRGEKELTFLEYQESLTLWQRFQYAYKDWSQAFFKQAGFHYLKRNYLRFLGNLFCAALFNPGYFLQKMKYNMKNS